LIKYTHIVFGDSSNGILKYVFENKHSKYNGEIIAFREDHSIGPLHEIDTEEGLEKRFTWLRGIHKEVFAYEYSESYEEAYMSSYEILKNIGEDSIVVIWHGDNTGDQVGVRYLCASLRNRELYEVNVSESYIESYDGWKYQPRALAECRPEEVDQLILTMKKMDEKRCHDLRIEWETLRTSMENLRILHNDIIMGVDEDFYDQEIVANCTFNFKKAARVVGKTMGESNQLVGDTCIDWRIRRLIESGQIEYRGKLETMRDYEIRVPGSLHDFFTKLFEKSSERDEDGFYHYLLERKDTEVVVDTTPIKLWHTIELSDKLILSYDENNIFGLTWIKDGIDLISINHTLISNIEYRVDEDNEEMRSEAILLYSEDLIGKRIEIQTKPCISIVLRNL